ncbi:uncharacterized protein TNCV_852041 [Trichonephila clavipes]|nr:uncharacterized protein TNCV_852041 [Trichonephila clavipes]
MYSAIVKPWFPRVLPLPPAAGLNGFGYTVMFSIYLPVVYRRMLGPPESQVLPLISHKLGKYIFSTLQEALFICYKQSPDNAHSVAFSQRSSSPRLTEDEIFNDSNIINNLILYEDGQEEPDSLRADKNIQESSFPTNLKSIVLKYLDTK